jgi:small subunit ribosomal protein S27e
MPENFLRVECGECGNEQTIFSHAATEVECLVCGEVLAHPQGGKVDVNGDIVEELVPE